MTQPPYQPPQQPYGQQPQPMPPQPAPVKQPSKKRFGWLPLLIATAVALILGAAVGAAGGGDPGTAAPAVTVTTTETVEVEVPAEEPSTEPTAAEPTEEPAGFKARKKDFAVKVKITDKQCFDTAGCSLDYKITPQYIGSQELPDTGVIDVTYEITGDKDPIVGSFTIEGGQVEYDAEGFMSTPRSSTKVKARITDAEYDENG